MFTGSLACSSGDVSADNVKKWNSSSWPGSALVCTSAASPVPHLLCVHHCRQLCLSEESFLVFITFFTRQHNKPHTAQFLNRNKLYNFIATVKISVNQQTGLVLLFYTENYLESLCLSSVSMGNLPNIILALPLSFACIKNIGQTPSLWNKNCAHIQLKAGLRAMIWYILIFFNSSPRS